MQIDRIALGICDTVLKSGDAMRRLDFGAMNIKFWGVRGSIPTPSTPNFPTSRYGGNTTCMSVHAPGVILIFDGGSGLRSLGMFLQPTMPVHATFFFSHLHWDHIQGFPFFTPAYLAGNSFEMHGPKL